MLFRSGVVLWQKLAGFLQKLLGLLVFAGAPQRVTTSVKHAAAFSARDVGAMLLEKLAVELSGLVGFAGFKGDLRHLLEDRAILRREGARVEVGTLRLLPGTRVAESVACSHADLRGDFLVEVTGARKERLVVLSGGGGVALCERHITKAAGGFEGARVEGEGSVEGFARTSWVFEARRVERSKICVKLRLSKVAVGALKLALKQLGCAACVAA